MAFRVELSVWLTLFLITWLDISTSEVAVQYRLPNNTSPEHYNIKISTKLEEDGFRFSGVCEITAKVLLDTSEIVLHSKLSKIGAVTVVSSTLGNITGRFSQTEVNEFLTITPRERLTKGTTVTVTIWYFSELRTDKLGFYRSSYIDEEGAERWLAVTQLAPTEARHAFPCYDEPNRKATFQIEIRHPKKLKAISNTDAITTVVNTDGTKTTTFDKTRLMSTYLVGFLISDFKNLAMTSPELKMEFEFYGVGDKIFDIYPSSVFAIDLFKTFATFLPVSLPVYHKTFRQVAVPDFYFSGMENWGIVMYKESSFIYKERHHSESDKVRAITLIGHEMAHNWFGNAVTMDWWTYVWLNEGFSTLYSYYGAQQAYPKYDFMEVFLVENMQPVLTFDGTASTRQITKYVENQLDIMKSYDKIAYNKAACVLRMWEHAFGRQNFKIAVDHYLKDNQNGNVEERHLVSALKKTMPNVTLEIIENTVKSWTSQKGYPVLTVIRDYDASTVTLTQERFMNLGEVDKVSVWRIPINFGRGNTNEMFEETTADIWMDKRTLKLSGVIGNGKNITAAPNEWVIFNKQQTGYYRVNYDEKNWKLITQGLRSNHIYVHVLNRAQLIDDAFALASAGRLNYSMAFRLIGYMSEETAYAPWATLQSRFLELKQYLHGTTSYTALLKYFGKLAEKRVKADKKTFDPPPMQRLTNEIVYNFFCEYEPSNCPIDYRSIWVTPGFRSVYYCNGIKVREKHTYLEIRHLLREEDDFKIRRDVLSALGCASDELLLSILLSSTTETPSDLKLAESERELLLKSIYQSGSRGLNRTLKFISTEWKSIELVMPGSLNTIIPDLAKYVNTLELKAMFELMASNIDVSADALTTASWEITNNMRWNLIYRHDVEAALSSSSRHFLSLGVLLLVLIGSIYI